MGGRSKSKKRNNQQGKSRSKTKKRAKNKNSKRRKTVSKKKKMKSPQNSKATKKGKQTKLNCPTLSYTDINNNRKYLNKWRQAKNIERIARNLNNKKEKASVEGTFNGSANAMKVATDDGTVCEGKPIAETPEAKTAFEILKNCSVSAADACDISSIPGYDPTFVRDCITPLGAFVEAYKACALKPDDNEKCTCFGTLPTVDPSCASYDFKALETKFKKKKQDSCQKRDVAGSFSSCRFEQRQASVYGVKCLNCSTNTTTTPNSQSTGTSARRARNLLNRGMLLKRMF